MHVGTTSCCRVVVNNLVESFLLELCSWRHDSTFCYPGNCQDVPSSCQCAPGFGEANCLKSEWTLSCRNCPTMPLLDTVLWFPVLNVFYMYLCLSVCMSVYLCVCLCVCVSVCVSVCLSVFLSVGLSVYLSVGRYACTHVCRSVGLAVWLYICLSVCLSVCLTVCLYVSISVCLAVCLSVLLSV